MYKLLGVARMTGGFPAGALAALAERLEGCGSPWVVGGSTGLALRGAVLDRPPRDLDIYCDGADVPAIHDALSPFGLDAPADSETERYRSILSHYRLDGTLIELVGAFRITAFGSEYRTDVRNRLFPLGDSFPAAGRSVRVVPLGHELIFNVLRDRADRCLLVGSLFRQDPARHLSVLDTLLAANRLSAETVERIRQFAGEDPS